MPVCDDLDQLTYNIISCAYKVSNTLGCGFLEKVYENALMVEMNIAGLKARQQVPFNVRYRDVIVGDYVPDIVVEDSVVLEVKACAGTNAIHRAQCINYLRATGLTIALLMNFHEPRVKIDRIVNGYPDRSAPQPTSLPREARTP